MGEQDRTAEQPFGHAVKSGLQRLEADDGVDHRLAGIVHDEIGLRREMPVGPRAYHEIDEFAAVECPFTGDITLLGQGAVGGIADRGELETGREDLRRKVSELHIFARKKMGEARRPFLRGAAGPHEQPATRVPGEPVFLEKDLRDTLARGFRNMDKTALNRLEYMRAREGRKGFEGLR